MNINNINYGYNCTNYSNRFNLTRKVSPSFTAKGVFPGCFDPITNGHVDIIKRAASIFDGLTVLVSKNPAKTKSFLPVDVRISLIEKILKDENLKNVRVSSSTDYAVKYAKTDNADVIIRGVRDDRDFEYEMELHKISNKLDPNIDIVFFPTKPDMSTISSTEVRNRYEKQGDISSLVPKCVMEFLSRLKKQV